MRRIDVGNERTAYGSPWKGTSLLLHLNQEKKRCRILYAFGLVTVKNQRTLLLHCMTKAYSKSRIRTKMPTLSFTENLVCTQPMAKYTASPVSHYLCHNPSLEILFSLHLCRWGNWAMRFEGRSIRLGTSSFFGCTSKMLLYKQILFALSN